MKHNAVLFAVPHVVLPSNLRASVGAPTLISNPQFVSSCATWRYVGSPRGLVSCCKTNPRYSVACPAKLGKETPSVRYTQGTRRKGVSEDPIFQKERLAGAVGLEPTPSSLTVRCPTNWTTPQPSLNSKREYRNFCAPNSIRSILVFDGKTDGKDVGRNISCRGFSENRPREGSRPSPQSPIGILGFPSL